MMAASLLSALALGLVSLVVGLMVGTTGIGGFLIIPALAGLADLPMRSAMGTALAGSAINGLLAALLLRRGGHLDVSMAVPLSLGAAAFALGGAWLNRWLPLPAVMAALGAVMLAGSLLTLRHPPGTRAPTLQNRPLARGLSLALVGALSGLVAGLTGVGGPLISVPLLALLAYPVLPAMAASQVLQVTASAAGALPYWQADQLSWSALLLIVPLQLVGIRLGTQIAQKIDPRLASRVVTGLGILTGLAVLLVALVMIGKP